MRGFGDLKRVWRKVSIELKEVKGGKDAVRGQRDLIPAVQTLYVLFAGHGVEREGLQCG